MCTCIIHVLYMYVYTCFSSSLSPSLSLRRPSSRKRKTPIPSKRLSRAMHLGDSEDESFGSGTPDVSDGETPDDSSTVRIHVHVHVHVQIVITNLHHFTSAYSCPLTSLNLNAF